MVSRPIFAAMFDVKPVNESGVLDFGKITSVRRELNLRVRAAPVAKIPRQKNYEPEEKPAVPENVFLAAADTSENLKHQTLRELEATLASSLDLSQLLSETDTKTHDAGRQGKPRYVPSVRRAIPFEERHAGLIREISRPLTAELAAADEPAVLSGPVAELAAAYEYNPVAEFYDNAPEINMPVSALPWPARTYDKFTFPGGFLSRLRLPGFYISGLLKRLRSPKVLMALIPALILGGLAVYYILTVKSEITAEGSAGAKNLQAAKDSLKLFDFVAAADNFSSAYDEFSLASEKMTAFSGSIGSVLEYLPGGGKLRSAKNLVEVGKLISEAGQSMTDVINAVSKTGWVLNPQNNTRVLSGEILTPLKRALRTAKANITEASELLEDVDLTDIPADRAGDIADLKSKIPEFESLLSDAGDYVAFFESLVAAKGTRRYMLLFQNNSELRPTGGFPGTYGIATFEGGRLKDFFADDIYNADGQLKELIVPPLQIQHIAPNWGMRDANWFIDFPVSAKKIMQFVPLELKYEVDGVITFNPTMMMRLLKAVGPITVPGFDYTITAENFLDTVQGEVEYGEHKQSNQPKKIVSDMAPLLLEKLYSSDKSKWLEIFNTMMAGLEQKDIVMYFKDPAMQKFAVGKGYGGEVKRTDGDFLMATFSNIKGSKTDAVTDTAMQLESDISRETVRHRLTLTRRHNGGSEKLGFYNRQNSSFVRLLVPYGAKLISVNGNSNPSFRPLLDYPKTDFDRDYELEKLENSARKTEIPGVIEMTEAGKTEFAFWMLTDPGEIKTVEVEYEVPIINAEKYELYVQKQPGLIIKNFEFRLQPAPGADIEESSLDLKLSDGVYIANDNLQKDLPITIKFK